MDEVAAYWNQVDPAAQRRSHWRDAMMEDWDRTRVSHEALMRGLWPELFATTLRRRRDMGFWIDWGCGGGATVAAIVPIARQVVGVDISYATLDACSQVFASTEPGACSFVPWWIDAGQPEQIYGQWYDQAEGFASTSCFQHFPSKEYTERVVALIPRLVRPGGYVFVQIRRDSPENPAYDPGTPYAERAIYATTYGVEEFGGLLEAHGVNVHRIVRSERARYTYYMGRVAGED